MNELFQPGEGFLSRKSRRRIALENARRRYAVNPVLMALNLAGANTDRGESGNIWSDCPYKEIQEDKTKGCWFEDDFMEFALPGTQTTAIQVGRYAAYAGSGTWKADAMPHSATPLGSNGVISVLTGDNAAAALGTAVSPFNLTTTQVGGKIWFEGRVALTSILTNRGQFFFGLGETAVTTYSATIPLGNADATSNAIVMIGFNSLEDGLSVLNTSYADHATSWTDIQTTASTGVLAANTWIKLGMKIDFSDTLRCVRFYVNNVECTTAMTKAALLALTHVDVKGLGPLIAFYGDSEGSDYVYIDWWKAAQLLP